ncbi:protein of unassigned function [Methylobacterium oryzae CBMB20]|uniref:Protein of unassigned function n=1 Tax=Methylobacterium oryzae CBMB20 TaxID=693986 RepID=A0A089NZ63_9HYPH|nr:protein of unassigned function [Methylobacterium oryzae CBMB20]
MLEACAERSGQRIAAIQALPSGNPSHSRAPPGEPGTQSRRQPCRHAVEVWILLRSPGMTGL